MTSTAPDAPTRWTHSIVSSSPNLHGKSGWEALTTVKVTLSIFTSGIIYAMLPNRPSLECTDILQLINIVSWGSGAIVATVLLLNSVWLVFEAQHQKRARNAQLSALSPVQRRLLKLPGAASADVLAPISSPLRSTKPPPKINNTMYSAPSMPDAAFSKYKTSPVLRSPQPLKVSPKAVGVASPNVHTPMTPGMLEFNRTLGVASRFGSGALGITDEYSSPVTPGLGFSPKGLGYLPAYELSPSNWPGTSMSGMNSPHFAEAADHTHANALRKQTYMVACKSPQVYKPGEKKEEVTLNADEVWRKLNIYSDQLEVSSDRCRQWLARIILARLSEEIYTVNALLREHGSGEQIGQTSFAKLELMAKNASLNVPSLATLIPYLKGFECQKYFVQRVHELGADRLLGGYRWNGGSDATFASTHTVQWFPEYPTDSQIVFHLFCRFMDEYIYKTHRYEGRAGAKNFSSLHVLRDVETSIGDVLKGRADQSRLYLLDTSADKHSLKVIFIETDSSIQILEIPQGRNNLFHALVVFLALARDRLQGAFDDESVRGLGDHGLGLLNILSWK